MEAFVYCWTDHKKNMLYIGSHKGDPGDGYVCSSKHMLKEYKKRPGDFTRQIIASGEWRDMLVFEGKILKFVGAKLDESFYNKHENDGLFFEGWTAGTMTKEHRHNMSKAASKRKLSPEHKRKLNEGRRNSKNSQKHNEAIRQYNLGKNLSEETKQKISVKRKNNPKGSEISAKGGKSSQEKRKQSGYYKSQEWKDACKKGWETRRKIKGGLVNGD